jgi:hypothetical protein
MSSSFTLSLRPRVLTSMWQAELQGESSVTAASVSQVVKESLHSHLNQTFNTFLPKAFSGSSPESVLFRAVGQFPGHSQKPNRGFLRGESPSIYSRPFTNVRILFRQTRQHCSAAFCFLTLSTCALHAPPVSSSWFYQRNNTTRRIIIVELPLCNFLQLPVTSSLCLQTSPRYPVPRHLQSDFFPLRDQVSHPYKATGVISVTTHRLVDALSYCGQTKWPTDMTLPECPTIDSLVPSASFHPMATGSEWSSSRCDWHSCNSQLSNVIMTWKINSTSCTVKRGKCKKVAYYLRLPGNWLLIAFPPLLPC